MWLCAVPEIVQIEVAVLVFVAIKQTRTKVFWCNSLNVLAFPVSPIFNNHTNKTRQRRTVPIRSQIWFSCRESGGRSVGDQLIFGALRHRDSLIALIMRLQIKCNMCDLEIERTYTQDMCVYQNFKACSL